MSKGSQKRGLQEEWRHHDPSGGSRGPAACRHPAQATKMPKKKVCPAWGAVKEEPKRRPVKLSVIPVPAYVETLPKRVATKDKCSDKKSANKWEKGKQAEVTNQEAKEDLPEENRETKNKESPSSGEAEEKEVKSD